MVSLRAMFVLLIVALFVGRAEAAPMDAGNVPSWPQFRGPKTTIFPRRRGC